MALVRVYCGLTTADPRGGPDTAGSPLVAAMVDDAGRTVDVCDVPDDPRGYTRLSSLLTERASGPYSVAIAADCAERLVPRLLATAGWAIALTGGSAPDDYAARFTDGAAGTGAAARRDRALGLARALHAGSLVATTVAPPPGFAELKPILAADGALATGRYGATVALREVLRELYPAALRAYPDPGDPVALAVIDALPEAEALSAARGSDTTALLDAAAARLTHDRVADHATITEAVTALRVAVAETPRRNALHPDIATTVSDAVRQAVAAVRACDAARRRLQDALGLWMAGRAGGPADAGAAAGAARAPAAVPNGADTWQATPAPAGGRTLAAGGTTRVAPAATPHSPDRDGDRSGASAVPAGAVGRSFATGAGSAAPRPVSSPPPPPGITPISSPPPTVAPAARSRTSPADRSRTSPDQSRTSLADRGAAGNPPGSDVRVPVPRPAPEGPPRGARDGWPTSPPPDDWAATAARAPAATPPAPKKQTPVTPPWRADDLRPPEPPPLRLVEQAPPTRPRVDPGGPPSTSPLRLVEPGPAPRSAPPVDTGDDDSDLLIFAQARSAWFSGRRSEPWTSPMDEGWRAAEQAAHPTVDDLTESGLPRRVPHANLVPGSPPRDSDPPLRVVRDPSTIAANTSGYFNGWRRGQEVGGYPLGNRVGNRSGGAWEFARDDRMSS